MKDCLTLYIPPGKNSLKNTILGTVKFLQSLLINKINKLQLYTLRLISVVSGVQVLSAATTFPYFISSADNCFHFDILQQILAE